MRYSEFFLRVLNPPPRIHADRGTSAVEYGLMLAAIFVVIAAIVIASGAQVDAIFTDIVARYP